MPGSPRTTCAAPGARRHARALADPCRSTKRAFRDRRGRGRARRALGRRRQPGPSTSGSGLRAGAGGHSAGGGAARASASNQLIDRGAAPVSSVSVLAPGQDPERVRDRVIARLVRSEASLGCGASRDRRAEGCRCRAGGHRAPKARPTRRQAPRARGSATDARHAVLIGCGGTIPFLGPFSRRDGRARPPFCSGLEDPICNAHGENESLHLGDFRKAAHSAAHLFEELTRLREDG